MAREDRLTWTRAMEDDLIRVLQADPGPPTQAIRNAVAILSEQWGVALRFAQVQAKVFYLTEAGRLRPQTGYGVLEGEPSGPPTVERLGSPPRLGIESGWLGIGDLHAPFVRWTMLAEAVERARRAGIGHVLIAGDLWDMGAFSVYPRIVTGPGMRQEREAAPYTVDMLARWFERVVCFSGNHDWRLLKQLMGAFPAQTAEGLFLELIGGARGGRVTWSVFGHAEVDSPTGPWRFPHQRNYSRIRGRVAVQLAAKYARHIVTFHEHGLGKLPSDCGRFTCAASGCLANWDHMAYMQLVDTTAPAWVNGYVMLDATGAIEVYGAVPGWGAPLVPSGSLSAEA